MSDEDLLDELRRTLHQRAGRLRPGPGRLPGAETTGAQHGGPGVPGEAYDRDPTARLRILRFDRLGGRAGRPRSRPFLIGGAVLAAAAGIAAAVGLSVSGSSHPKLTFTTEQTATTQQTAPAPTPTAPPTTAPQLTTPIAPPTTASVPPSTAPPAPVKPVPAGFQPLSVTFVSQYTGWASGQYPCPGGECLALAGTYDGGRTWSARNAPAVPLTGSSESGAPVAVRFADRLDGWITTSSGLWSTHDGGYLWSRLVNPAGPDGRIVDLEAAAGTAYLVTISPSSPVETVYSTAVTTDDWTAAPLHPGVGAGPVPTAQLILFGHNGWIVDVDRTTTAGARLAPGAGWQAWTPPCASAGGPGLLGAASASDLVAVCEEGVWGTTDPGTQPNQDWLFRSTDSGATFSPAGPVPAPTAGTYSITAAPGQASTVVVATSAGLIATFDGGQTWRPVYGLPSSGPEVGADFVGFTTATQGVAVLAAAGGTTMVMTRDGGHTWQPVDF